MTGFWCWRDRWRPTDRPLRADSGWRGYSSDPSKISRPKIVDDEIDDDDDEDEPSSPIITHGAAERKYIGLDAHILGLLGPYKKQSKDLRQEVIDTYGYVERRQLYRRLARLVRAKLIERTTGEDELGRYDVLGFYRLVKMKEPGSEDPGSR